MLYNETASMGDRGRNAATFLVVKLLGKRFVEEQSLRPVALFQTSNSEFQ